MTEQLLGALGVNVCGDIVRNIAMISALMTPSLIDFCLGAGLGLGQTTHASPAADDDPGRKGISCERTFKPISQKQDLEAMVNELRLSHAHAPLACLRDSLLSPSQASSLVTHLCDDMASEGLEGKTITLKIKLVSFEIRTRAATLPAFSSKPEEMLPVVCRYAAYPVNLLPTSRSVTHTSQACFVLYVRERHG